MYRTAAVSTANEVTAYHPAGTLAPIVEADGYMACAPATANFDQTKIMRDIRNTLDGGNNVLVYGPRRYGKSSLVGEILNAIRNEGDACIELNMMDIASPDDFVARHASDC